MQNIDLTPMKVRVLPIFEQILQTTFNEQFRSSIARGLGWTPTIIEEKKRIENQIIEYVDENGETKQKEEEVTIFEGVEIKNPVTEINFIANIYFDILMEKSLIAINIDFQNHTLPEIVQNSMQPFINEK